MSAPVDVLAVMERSRNVSVANAREFPASATLTRHADECEQARAAVAELIEAGTPLMGVETFAPWDKLRDDDLAMMKVGTIRRLRAALARVQP